MIIVCPGCSTKLRLPDETSTLLVQCPNCSTRIDTTALRSSSEAGIRSQWYYMEEGWISDKEVGPIPDDRLLAFGRIRKIKPETLVRSPELTQGHWRNLHQVVGQVEEAIRQRERARIAAEEERLRREQIRQVNLNRLGELMRDVVADGIVTKDEQDLIKQFSQQAQISGEEVRRIFQLEGNRLVGRVLEEALSDGEFSPEEEEQLQRISKGLGLPLAFDNATDSQIELAKLCWLFNNCELDEFPTIEPPFKLQSKESCFGVHSVEWNSVRRTGESVRLTCLGVGTAYITDKRVVLVTNTDSKSIRHTSIAKVERYQNGTLLVRSSGGSVFLRFTTQSVEDHKFSLLLERVCLSGEERVTAVLPASVFSTHVAPKPIVDRSPCYASSEEPRFTFRVVGNHIGNRQACIDALRLGDAIYFIREPNNPVDENAVAIVDSRRNHLGYLKQEVAEWFGPLLDRGDRFTSNAYRKRSDGALIIGVYQA